MCDTLPLNSLLVGDTEWNILLIFGILTKSLDLNKAISVCLQEVSDWETRRQPGWRLYHHLGCLRIQVNTWHTCAPLYSAPAAYILQNAALQTWQQYARWSLLGAQLSHLLPFLFSAQSSASAWLGWDVKWQLLLLQRRVSYEGHTAQRKIKPSVCPGHDNLLLYDFLLVNGQTSGCSWGFVIRALINHVVVSFGV